MVNLLDIMRQAQQGAVMDNFARQFGLSPTDTQRAVETLLPAFSLGFRRNALNPGAFGPFLDALSSGRYAPFFDGRSGPALGGPELIGQIFGSPDVARGIAAQASTMTGIGTQVLQQMMPAMAAVLMGGLSRYASLEGVSDAMRQWADWLKAAAPTPEPPPKAPDLYGAWADMVGQMFGAPAKPPQGVPAQETWSRLVGAMMGVSPPPPPPPAPAQPSPFAALAQMFEAGREVQAQHLAGFQQVLDGMWSGGRTR